MKTILNNNQRKFLDELCEKSGKNEEEIIDILIDNAIDMVEKNGINSLIYLDKKCKFEIVKICRNREEGNKHSFKEVQSLDRNFCVNCPYYDSWDEETRTRLIHPKDYSVYEKIYKTFQE